MRVIGILATLIMLSALIAAVMTFPAMLLLGAAHSYDAIIPALGFKALFFLGLSLRWLITMTVGD